MSSKSRKPPRRTPKQARSRAAREAIVEAAAQILERRGTEGFTTNHIADRAGVSIGTLYQYFADKEQVLLAAIAKELAALPRRQRALIEALIALAGSFGAGGAAAALPTPRSPIQRRRRRNHATARALDVAVEWLCDLVGPSPALRPIAIDRRPTPRR